MRQQHLAQLITVLLVMLSSPGFLDSTLAQFSHLSFTPSQSPLPASLLLPNLCLWESHSSGSLILFCIYTHSLLDHLI